MKTILIHEYVTGGGLTGQELPESLAAEGTAIRRALAAEFGALHEIRVVMTLDARLPDEPGPWRVARVGEGEEPERFATLASEVDGVVLVAPETGGALLDRARIIENVAGRSLGSTPQAIELAADKLRLAERLASRGVPTPPSRSVVPAEGPPRGLAYPVVLKPVDGAGSIDTYYVESAEAWPQQAPAGSLAQPFVPGQPLSASFLVGSDGRAHLVGVGEQRFERHERRFTYRGGVVPFATSVATTAARKAIEAVPGLRGWVGVDLIWQPATCGLTVLEINPRPTTSLVGWRLLLRPPGRLASLWLRMIEHPGPVGAEAMAVHAGESVEFAADGSIVARSGGSPR